MPRRNASFFVSFLMKVGLIGYGHFGQAFAERFRSAGLGIPLLISEGRGKNAELLKQVDTLILSVRPFQLVELCNELREPLKHYGKEEKCIVSFTAATPQTALTEALGYPVLRAMADLQFEQILSQPDPRLNELFSAMSANPFIEVSEESALEDYTILIACFAGIVAWQKLHNLERAEEWLSAYAQYIHEKLSVPLPLLQAIVTKGLQDSDPAGTIFHMATPGGITESLIQQLEQKPTSNLEELYSAGWARTQQVREAVMESLKCD